MYYIAFSFDGPATDEIYTLSLYDALPISNVSDILASSLSKTRTAYHADPKTARSVRVLNFGSILFLPGGTTEDRKSTRLNSSHSSSSYAVFCLKKKTHCVLLTICEPSATY